MCLKKWAYAGELVELCYADGTIVNVSKRDFDRAFGAIINAPKDAVIRDFAVVNG